MQKGMRIPLLILVCLLQSGTLLAQTLQVQRLHYEVTETGQTPYLSRMLVTEQMVRIDQGSDTADFILFDRAEQVIYSVDSEERTVLVIKPKPVNQPDTRLPEIKVLAKDAGEAPLVAGRKAQHWALQVNGQPCQEAMVLPEMMAMSVAAQVEYLGLLAEQHKISLSGIPMAYRDECADAIQVYAPDALLGKGLPLRLWDINGNQQALTDYRESETVDADLFTLPEAYTRKPMPQ
ncbi:MAG: hypothetical protein N0C81_09990 [Candidatus Thiodiazotropha lotti]|uniref:DUF4412 domain-containing protein n=1 Tax=Candidatus Thiodiazotropha lotti TaxID=2792787 RepID=A0A9E4N1X3_9GAMM|nr:hypothetical protein [Candidatus Thiodiazotropha lotti]ODC01505.1 hypothetical protein A3197_03250 [Candidatus Thiodiazotropha endoloripes]MCG7920639.1 hypothetical protein [Candidatus Thiodiazotropha lotti]MCG7930684.1 hypothetical protein [Candidatus Thiodiazotropha lotti]MCG7940039.1 hypothetical protein [Candidatus Thiodiazotropha lotti]